MGWRVVYIEEAMNVKLYLDNIKITRPTGDVTIPLADIHSLIIDNQQLTITIPLINKCTQYNINLCICNLEHMPQSLIYPFSGNYQYPIMLKKQINWSSNMKEQLHQLIIKNKINNQIDLLKFHNKSQFVISKIYQFKEEVDLSDIYNREGLAAKMYFRELFGPNFKRFDDDILNAGLNYGYSILRSQISKTLISKGLNPSIGIFHRGYDNQFNLSDDIIEVFRPIVDNYCYKNLTEAIIFKREHRIDLIKQTTIDARIISKKQTLFNTISIYIDKIIECFDSDDASKYEQVNLIYEL